MRVGNGRLAGALSAVAIGLCGCGSSAGPSLSAFKRGFASDKAQFRQLGADLGSALEGARGKSDSQVAAEFETLSARVRQQADRLRGLNPPPGYKAGLGQLAAGFGMVSADLHAFAAAARASNLSEARAAGTTFLHDVARVRLADRSLTGRLGLPQTG